MKTNRREVGWDRMDCLRLTQDRGQWRALVNTLMNVRIPYNFRKVLSS
jgi:hypothetical protein